MGEGLHRAPAFLRLSGRGAMVAAQHRYGAQRQAVPFLFRLDVDSFSGMPEFSGRSISALFIDRAARILERRVGFGMAWAGEGERRDVHGTSRQWTQT
jgi:hypothetical protein